MSPVPLRSRHHRLAPVLAMAALVHVAGCGSDAVSEQVLPGDAGEASIGWDGCPGSCLDVSAEQRLDSDPMDAAQEAGDGDASEFPVTNSYWIDVEGHYPSTGLGTWSEASVTPSGTACNIKESAVYLTALVHAQDDDHRWQLRVGKGSQLYSIRTALGNLTGEQGCNPERPGPWMDRVLQFVLVDKTLNTDPDKPYFIHQAGTYEAPAIGLNTPFWSPLLGKQMDPAEATLRTLVWPQQAHVYANISWQSRVLAQQHVRDAGDGIIEITYVITNFGDDTFDHTNMPWSGFARNAIPNYVLSKPDGGWTWFEPAAPWNDNTISYDDTNGWLAMVQDKSQTARGLGVVFGRRPGKNLPGAVVRFGAVPTEDLTVLAAISKAVIAPGETFFARYYLVVGRLSADIHPRANALAGHVDMGTLAFELAATGSIQPCSQAPDLPGCELFRTLDRPAGTPKPLLLLRDLTDQHLLVSSDPYALSVKPYLGTTTGYVAFLGWGMESDVPPHPEMIRLSSVLSDPSVYPDSAKGHDLWVLGAAR